MNYFKLLLITLLFVGCNEDSPDAFESETSGQIPSMTTESNELATCISGVYSGEGDFTKFTFGSTSFNLEVSTNSRELVFLVTATESKGETNEGDQFCSVYQTPEFISTTPRYDDDNVETTPRYNVNYLNIESDSVISTGRISQTFAISKASVRRALVENEDGTTTTCSLSTRIEREPGSPGHQFVSLNSKRDDEAETRSFSEIRSICSGLETQEVEEVTETEVPNIEAVDLQDPTQ